MSEPIRVLHVDDDPDSAALVATHLERENERFAVETATGAHEGLGRIEDESFDCVVSDYEMPGQNGIELLEQLRERYPELPFVLYTGRGSEEIASEAISAGVTDYLQKGTGTSQYTVLANRIANAVEKYRSQRGLEASRERLSLFIDQSSLGVIEWDENFEFVGLNPAAEDLLGYDETDLAGRSWEAIVPEDQRAEVREVVGNLLENEGGFHSVNENVRKDGERIVCEWHNRVVTDAVGEVVAIFSQFQDVTDRVRRERAVEELHETAGKLMSVSSIEGAAEIVVDAAADVLDMPANAVHLYDESVNGLKPVAWTEYGAGLVDEVPTIAPGEGLAWEVYRTGETRRFEDVSAEPDRLNPETPIRSEIILPLGEHGVLLVGSADPGQFDETDVSLAETLSIHATTALDRLERQQDLARQRSLLEAQQESVLDGILVVDEDREIISYNDRFAEMWEIPEEVLDRADDRTALDRVADHLADPEAFQQTVASLYERPEATARDEIELEDGRIFDRYTTPLTGEEGTDFGRMWTFRDITARKEREEELRRNEQIIQRMNDGVVVVRDEVIRYTNPQVSELTGYDPDALRGRPMGEFIAPADRETVRDRFQERIAGGSPPSSYEINVLAADGEAIPVEITVERIEYGGQPATVSIVRDVRERKQRKRELERQNEQLEEFANLVSHDLRNPLSVAQSRVELARDEIDNEHLKAAARAHDRMEALIDDVLTLAREGRQLEDTEPVELRSIVEECWRNVDTANATLSIETARTVVADRSRLGQILENLVRNAVEHGGDGVAITVGELERGFFVADDGPGIPADERELAFETGYSTAASGTGFGLDIVEQIADAHGWAVDLTASETGGARFEITGVEFGGE